MNAAPFENAPPAPAICGIMLGMPDPAFISTDFAATGKEIDGLRIIDLDRMAYAPALELQRQIHAQVVAGEAPPTVLLLEHDPVITVSRRKSASRHLLASPQTLGALGIDVQETDRGGDVTYHGPGQLVAYPIVRLAPLGLNVGRYMRLLEQIIIDAITPFSVRGERDACATGVWVRMNPANPAHEANAPRCDLANAAGSTAKIAALGVRLSRNVTLHGLALNVTTDLSHFNTIVPCGLLNRTVTSLEQVLGDAVPSMERVKMQLVASLRRHLLTREN